MDISPRQLGSREDVRLVAQECHWSPDRLGSQQTIGQGKLGSQLCGVHNLPCVRRQVSSRIREQAVILVLSGFWYYLSSDDR